MLGDFFPKKESLGDPITVISLDYCALFSCTAIPKNIKAFITQERHQVTNIQGNKQRLVL